MNYLEQQRYLQQGRLWAAVCVVILMAASASCFSRVPVALTHALIAFALTILALAVSLCYTPDYLNLTATSQKKAKWQTKIRWRVVAAALILGVLLAPHWQGTIAVVVSVVWLAGANFLAKAVVPSRSYAAYFWTADLALVCGLLLTQQCSLLLAAVLIAVAAHLAILAAEVRPISWAFVFTLFGGLLLSLGGARYDVSERQVLPLCGLVLGSSMATAWLVHRAQQRNAKNVAAAMQELMEFTGYPADRVWHLWSVSNQELARNWQAAALDENDRERMAAWYRENSELYLFAISAYNLEYKRILSNLRMLQFGRGACLDYGAGNGELLLELARRGHAVTYFDVEGTTMKFARQRAQRQGLAMEFMVTKEQLAEAAKKRGFDTIFSFDVLEHLPDLPAELNFLSSLLSAGGLMVFDVPAGSTKAHPMHLNHNLDVRAHLTAKGLEEKRSLVLGLPFLKQEKYAFRVRT